MPYLKTATEELKRLILWSAAGWYQKHIRKRTNGRIPEWDSAETYFGMAVIESLRWFLYQKSGCHTYTRNSLWSNWGELYKLHPSQQKGNHKAVKGAVIIVEIIGDIHSAIDLFPGVVHIVIELFEEKEYTQIYSEKSIDMCFVEVMLQKLGE